MNPKHLNIIKRRKKYISLHLDCDIRSKSQSKNKSDIQQEIIKQMKVLRKNTLSSDLAVQIITYTTDKRSPGIDKWAKNIIDILHKPEYLINSDEQIFLPFIDDKQIKYLYVQYIYAGDSSNTHITILPFTGFISDLHLVNEIDNKNKQMTFEPESNYHELLVDRDKYLSFLSEKAYNSLLKMNLETEQRQFGKIVSLNPHFIRTCFPKKNSFNKYFKNTNQEWAEVLLKTPIKLKLPGLPKNGSEDKEISQNYKEKIRLELKKYIEKYTIMKDLQGPIIVSVIYRPAKNKIEKDIDNILLEYVMPIVNDVLNPPASLHGITEYSDFISGDKRSAPLAKDKKGTSIGYEIIRVPQFSENEEGVIYLGFRLDAYEDTIIDYAQNQIDKYLEEDG